MKSLTVLMFLLVTIAGIIQIVRSQSCPSECSCTSNSDGNGIIDCSNRGLTEVVEVAHPQPGGKIAKIDFSNNMLTTLDIDKLYTLIRGLIVDELDFSLNSINVVTGTFDADLGRDYETLNLSSNAFSSFPANIVPVRHLRTKFIIDFSYNQLTELTAHMFASGNDFFLPGFQFLARNNLINKVHDETFQGVELTDTILDLRYNRLTTLSPGFQSPRGVEALRFSNNPWHCDCNLRWIIAKDRFLVNHTALDPPNCQTPVSLRGHPVFTLREEEFTCLPYREGSLRRDIPGTNTDFTLSCPVTADPPNPEISWTVWLPCPSEGNPLQFDFISETVTLSDITTNPRAAFRCTATNNAGSIDLDLDIRYNGEMGIDIPGAASNPMVSQSALTQTGRQSPISNDGRISMGTTESGDARTTESGDVGTTDGMTGGSGGKPVGVIVFLVILLLVSWSIIAILIYFILKLKIKSKGGQAKTHKNPSENGYTGKSEPPPVIYGNVKRNGAAVHPEPANIAYATPEKGNRQASPMKPGRPAPPPKPSNPYQYNTDQVQYDEPPLKFGLYNNGFDYNNGDSVI